MERTSPSWSAPRPAGDPRPSGPVRDTATAVAQRSQEADSAPPRARRRRRRVGSWTIHANVRTSSSGCRTTVLDATRSRWRRPGGPTPSWSRSRRAWPNDSRSCVAPCREVRVPRFSIAVRSARPALTGLRTPAIRLAGSVPVGLLSDDPVLQRAVNSPDVAEGPVLRGFLGDCGWIHAARRMNPRTSERSTSAKHGFTRWAS